ncbi:NYN domain-containing protein [Ornithinicoccus hortensis]|uniref:Uncharacterized protein (TIGR00288 family) n=1 Tax=Ornithinicoccus hortensis TaxID=82346 RepID=A0A542YRR3_9MICO|nr:NYN domain-containing protein [Ornithinicoccus hortensis]TQL50792.1 uncharacterized protein (TIGR00288 family) [Ornithinicoccus hortensis]
MDHEERIALFLDYENLALGAREHLGGMTFDVRPIADALAERGRVVARRAYADWSYFDEDRRMLTRSHVELIEMPQRMGASRKNAADIKMAVDAIEMAFERDYISTFAMCTGDSDFTPLVHKLRELNKRVIGIGVRNSTSKMLPPACDEFLYYDTLEGVEPPGEGGDAAPTKQGRGGSGRSGSATGSKTSGRKRAGSKADTSPEPATSTTGGSGTSGPGKGPEPDDDDSGEDTSRPAEPLAVLVAQTLAGLQRSSGGSVTASVLKRTLLRKDPTFNEADHGFRAFGELLRHLAERNVLELSEGHAKGDPEVSLPELGDQEGAFALLRSVVEKAAAAGETVALSGLKDQLRRARPDFSEKSLGYGSFLQFCKAAATTGAVTVEWSDQDGGYVLDIPVED